MPACLDSAEAKQSKGLCPSWDPAIKSVFFSWGWPAASRCKPQEDGMSREGSLGVRPTPVCLELFLPGNLLAITA